MCITFICMCVCVNEKLNEISKVQSELYTTGHLHLLRKIMGLKAPVDEPRQSTDESTKTDKYILILINNYQTIVTTTTFCWHHQYRAFRLIISHHHQ